MIRLEGRFGRIAVVGLGRMAVAELGRMAAVAPLPA
jgi:hypothetical protein